MKAKMKPLSRKYEANLRWNELDASLVDRMGQNQGAELTLTFLIAFVEMQILQNRENQPSR